MKDPVVVLIHPDFYLENPLFVGYFSQIGGMFWFLAAGVCLTGTLIAQNQPLPFKNMLLHGFIFTLFLGIDDVFMFHDEIFRLYGVHENVFVVSYVAISCSFLLIYFKTILKTKFPLLALALFCLASSVLLDKVPGSFKEDYFQGIFNSIIFEDGFKMVGILFWLLYFTSVTKTAFDQAVQVFRKRERRKSGNINGEMLAPRVSTFNSAITDEATLGR